MSSNTQSTGVGVGQLSQDEKPMYALQSQTNGQNTELSAWDQQDWIGLDNSGDWNDQDDWGPS